jgi:2-C-methyl-D-erythritol 4-phosphate cytidylyltransferase
VIRAARDHRCVITGLPATDTVKEVGENNMVMKTYDRGRVWMAQTPQVFRYEDIRIAHLRAQEEGWGGITDDAALVERLGVSVKVIEGSEKNIKVTTSRDLELVRFWLSERQS